MDREQLEAQLNQRVAAGEISREEADDILASVVDTGLLVGQNPQEEQTPFQRVLGGNTAAEDLLAPVENLPNFDATRSAPQERLEQIAFNDVFSETARAEAHQELAIRREFQEQSFLELMNSERFTEDVVRRTLQAPASGLNGLLGVADAVAQSGFDALMPGREVGTFESYFEGVAANQQLLNEGFGIADPVNPLQSIVEAVPGALLGGLPGFAGEILLDQGLRELLDTENSPYATIFDRIGVPDSEQPALGPIAGILAAGAVATATPATVRWWRNSNPTNLGFIDQPSVMNTVTPPRRLNEIDPNAPDDIFTVETTEDLISGALIDQQTSLAVLGERMGIPGLENVRQRIDLETHAAAANRAGEALRTGRLSTLSREFSSPTPPRLLYDTYQSLPEDMRRNVSQYINLQDMRDDTLIAIREGTDPSAMARLARLNSQINAIRTETPVVTDFARRYNEVTGAVRTFMEDGMFSQSQRLALDADRPNYVPLHLSGIDENAPLMTRLQQARQADNDQASDLDYFLQQRNSTGSYDINRRGDPFDNLMDYTNSVLIAQMRNDTRLAFIDGLLESGETNGFQFTRLADDGELASNAGRTVSVIRNGEREVYLTSGFTADLLQFDPQISQHPWLYGPRRVAEVTSVGTATVSFAPVTFMRDVLAGQVIRPEGVQAVGFGQAAAAIPEQIFRSAQHSLSNYMLSRIDANGQAFPQLFGMDTDLQRRLAETMADSYANSMFSQIRSAGGFQASDIVTNTRIGSNRLQELQRTIMDTAASNPVTNNMVTRFGANSVRRSLLGFHNMFTAVIEAPRYANIRNTIEGGAEASEAALLGRQVTGDVSRGGSIFTSRGRVQADIAYPSVFSNAVDASLPAANVFMEGSMFINPMIQGNRALWNSFANDPVGTNLRMFTRIGLPAMAAYSWNVGAGEEYADYAVNGRTASDVAMNFYIAVPGRPPEEGIQIPIAHEMAMMNAPFMMAMHTLSGGMEEAERADAWWTLGSSILDTTASVGTPVTLQAVAAASGLNLSDNVFHLQNGSYETWDRPDSHLPDNLEHLARVLFTSVADTAIRSSRAFMEEDDGLFERFASAHNEAVDSVLRRAPVVSGLTGREQTHSQFSIPGLINRQNENAMAEFSLNYRMVRNQNVDGVFEYSNRNLPQIEEHFPELAQEDLPNAFFGGTDVTMPTNPFILEFGDRFHAALATNSVTGATGLDRRVSRANAISRRLRNFTRGHEEELVGWMADLQGAEDEDSIEVLQFLEQQNLDISVRGDRIVLSNFLQSRMSDLMRAQNMVVREVESQFTGALRQVGALREGEDFSITEHLGPYDNPFELTEEQLQQLQQLLPRVD